MQHLFLLIRYQPKPFLKFCLLTTGNERLSAEYSKQLKWNTNEQFQYVFQILHIIVVAKRPWRQCLRRAVQGNDTSLFSALLVTVKECRAEWIRGIWSRENSMLSNAAIVKTSLLGGLHSFSPRGEEIHLLWVSEEAARVCFGAPSSSLFAVALVSE